MWEIVILVLIIGAALFFSGRAFARGVHGSGAGGCGGGCAGCGSAGCGEPAETEDETQDVSKA